MEYNNDWLDSIGNDSDEATDEIGSAIEDYSEVIAATHKPKENTPRVGNFTSSEIYNLATKDRSGKGFGKPAFTYIEEKQLERFIGMSLDSDSRSKPLIWGRFAERVAFGHLGLGYTLCSQDTIVHPDIDSWCGTPDLLTSDAVGDIKCPFTKKSFAQLVKPLYDGLAGIDAMNKIRATHKDGNKYYWQLVSNAILTERRYAELVVYCPYYSELPKIKMEAEGDPDAHFIPFALDEELPYIIDGGRVKNLNIIRFEIPQEDKELLTELVLAASDLLCS